MISVDVLGPLRVRIGSDERPVGGRRERVLLALLCHPRPARRRRPDHRRALGRRPARGGDQRRPGGRLAPAAGAGRPRRGTPRRGRLRPRGGRGRRRPAHPGRRAGRWPGPGDGARDDRRGAGASGGRDPYVGLGAAPTLAVEATRLEEVRLVLVEARAQALLDLGRPAEAHRTLAPLVGAHPFRERLWSLLALALYRSDRQADALEALRLLRAALVDELGVDPSTSVRELEQRMLAQDPALDGPRRRDPARRLDQRRSTPPAPGSPASSAGPARCRRSTTPWPTSSTPARAASC